MVVDEGDPNAYPELDDGEASLLSAAAAVGGSVLIDERKARKAIVAHPELHGSIPHVAGIVGLILLAKQRKRIAAVRPLLDDLISQGFWMSVGLYQAVLEQAEEGVE